MTEPAAHRSVLPCGGGDTTREAQVTFRTPYSRAVIAGFIAVIGVVGIAAPAVTAPVKWKPQGQLDLDYGSQVQVAGGAATGERAESKLFYTPDNRWWAVLGTSSESEGAGVYLYEHVDHTWVARFKLPSSDPWMKADTLFENPSGLFISLRDQKGTSSGNPRMSLLYRYEYNGEGTWTALSTATPITTGNPEVLTIAHDGLDRVWATWEEASRIKVANTQPGGTAFPTPTFLPIGTPTAKVNGDDVSAITAFSGADGSRIGVVWSDQITRKFGFAWRDDDEPIGTWHVEDAYGNGVGGCDAGRLCSDDHIKLAVNGNQVYAAVKTSHNDSSSRDPNDPLIVVLRRSDDGSWESFPVSLVSDNASRPILTLNPEADLMHVFANYKGVHVWQSSLSAPLFTVISRSRWTAGGTGNPTSTRQVVGAASGNIVLTSHRGNTDYWHNEYLPETPPPPPE